MAREPLKPRRGRTIPSRYGRWAEKRQPHMAPSPGSDDMPTERSFMTNGISSRSLWVRSLPILACLLGAMIGVCDRASGVAAAKAGTTPRTSDQTAEALLSAMRDHQYDVAFSMFDATLQAAVPVEKLRDVWSAQLAALGKLTTWTISQRSQVQSRDVRIALLEFEHGRLQATISVNPQSQDVGGFVIRPYVQPAPPPAYMDPS